MIGIGSDHGGFHLKQTIIQHLKEKGYGETEKETATVVGNLCTALDIIAENIELPIARIGDIVSVSNAGSYGYSLSPLLFGGHQAPKQFLWE